MSHTGAVPVVNGRRNMAHKFVALAGREIDPSDPLADRKQDILALSVAQLRTSGGDTVPVLATAEPGQRAGC